MNFLLLKESHMNTAEKSSTIKPSHTHNPFNDYYAFSPPYLFLIIYLFYEATGYLCPYVFNET